MKSKDNIRPIGPDELKNNKIVKPVLRGHLWDKDKLAL
jgi:hypothetical protein